MAGIADILSGIMGGGGQPQQDGGQPQKPGLFKNVLSTVLTGLQGALSADTQAQATQNAMGIRQQQRQNQMQQERFQMEQQQGKTRQQLEEAQLAQTQINMHAASLHLSQLEDAYANPLAAASQAAAGKLMSEGLAEEVTSADSQLDAKNKQLELMKDESKKGLQFFVVPKQRDLKTGQVTQWSVIQAHPKNTVGPEGLDMPWWEMGDDGKPQQTVKHFDAGTPLSSVMTLAGKTLEQVSRTAVEHQKLEFAGKKMDVQIDQFKQTLDYKKWKEQLDTETRLRIGEISKEAARNKAPAMLISNAKFAKGGLIGMAKAETAMAELEKRGIMGASWAQNKAEDWVFGKGMVDPTLDADTRRVVGQLRAGMQLVGSALTQAHTNRTSVQIYQDFKQMMGVGQDWSALRGAMDAAKDLLRNYVEAASDESIKALREGRALDAVPAGGAGGGKGEIVIDIRKQ